MAIDADTAFGRLSSRIDPRVDGLVLGIDRRQEPAVLRRCGRPRRPQFRRPARARRRTGGRARAGCSIPRSTGKPRSRLDRHFTISVIDCGSTMDSPVTQEVLRDLDALIVVSSPWADGASAAARTMEWLADHGLSGSAAPHHRGAQRFRRTCRQAHPGVAGSRVRRSRTAGGRGALRSPPAARRRHRREQRNGAGDAPQVSAGHGDDRAGYFAARPDRAAGNDRPAARSARRTCTNRHPRRPRVGDRLDLGSRGDPRMVSTMSGEQPALARRPAATGCPAGPLTRVTPGPR